MEWQERAIRMAYFIRIPNVGDLANPSVVAAVTGRPVCHVTNPGMPHLLAIGSMMAVAAPLSQVWGTGVMHPDFGIGNASGRNIHALRGTLSHAAMARGGVIVGDVPFGDPAYLLPALLGVRRSSSPGARVGLVAHYVDRHLPIVRRLLQQPGVADLNVHEAPDTFLRRMAECETVVSTSLHGLVFAEAMGIPSLWARASDEIAGGDFKFQDWFSTTRRPQTAPYYLAPGESAELLARRAELHESTIDAGALTAAFPHAVLEQMQLPPGRRTMSLAACREHPTPIFLISCNRAGSLRQCIHGIRHLSEPTDLVVLDSGSSDPDTLFLLDELEAEGVRVWRHPLSGSPQALTEVNEAVAAYFADWAEPARYVVSDCGIDLSVAEPNALSVYDELLNRFRRVECVGPMLRIRDVQRGDKLFNRLMNDQIEQFWQEPPKLQEISCGDVAVRECSIDTTFALHRAGEAFRRLKSGLRVHEPFDARCLDWDLTDRGACAHQLGLAYREFYTVRRTSSGGLEVYQEKLVGDDPPDPETSTGDRPPR
jgi:pyruvyltransferase